MPRSSVSNIVPLLSLILSLDLFNLSVDIINLSLSLWSADAFVIMSAIRVRYGGVNPKNMSVQKWRLNHLNTSKLRFIFFCCVCFTRRCTMEKTQFILFNFYIINRLLLFFSFGLLGVETNAYNWSSRGYKVDPVIGKEERKKGGGRGHSSNLLTFLTKLIN